MKNQDKLNVGEVMKQFRELEESPMPHKGTFKINAPFEKAIDTILKAQPDPKKPKAKG